MKNFENLTDEQLAAMAAAGDSAAEEFLIRKYTGEVRGKAHLFFIMGSDSEDIVQEGMIGIFKAIHNYDPERGVPFKAFMEMCINRQIYTAIQAAGRMKHAPLNSSVSLNDDSDEQRGMIESIMTGPEEQPEEVLMFKDAVDSLNSNESKIFSSLELEVWHRFLDGMNYVEIAEELDKSPKSIDNALQRIKRKISEHLNC